jgi:simple sugar transport system permease protein
VLNNFLSFEIGGMAVPTGLLLFFALFCVILYYFFRTKAGLAIDATGQNESYAIASGVNTKRMRTIAVVMSNVLGGIGIVAYAQSYGFLQLYTGPMFMAFPAVAAILIGGASLRKASVTNVVVGTLLFQTLLTISLPVTAQVITGDITEIARLIIANGMIVYALTRGSGKGGR